MAAEQVVFRFVSICTQVVSMFQVCRLSMLVVVLAMWVPVSVYGADAGADGGDAAAQHDGGDHPEVPVARR